MDEIFGARKGTVYLEGLIDAESCMDFDDKLASLKSLWEERESSDNACTPGFFEWFQKNKVDVLKSSVIHPVRIKAGLGNPPEQFTTNASESLNAVIKSKVDYERSSLNRFIDKMKCLVDDQQKEIERSICCRGKYRFRLQYRFFEINEQKWFNMTPEARQKHVAKINRFVLSPDYDNPSFSQSSVNDQSQLPIVSGVPHPMDIPNALSVQLSDIAGSVSKHSNCSA